MDQTAASVFGKQFEQRNSIVIGFAMGFAVIPIIFTISEDAFTNVPAGYAALATLRWSKLEALRARSLFYSTERAKLYDYSDPLVPDVVAMAVHKGSVIVINTPADLAGHRIGLQEGKPI